jgi:hypothetical protein
MLTLNSIQTIQRISSELQELYNQAEREKVKMMLEVAKNILTNMFFQGEASELIDKAIKSAKKVGADKKQCDAR